MLAWNAGAAALLTDFAALPPEHRNVIRLTFLDPGFRALYGDDWAAIARDCVAGLCMEAGRCPEDPALAALVGELSVGDDEFRSWWSSHRVRGARPLSKTYLHPLVGPLTLDVQWLAVEGQSGQSLIAYTARPGTPSEESVRFLLQWSAGQAPATAGEPDGPRRADSRNRP